MVRPVMDEPVKTKAEQVLKLALNRIEAAEAISVSPATFDRLVLRGLIRPSRATRRPIFSVKELERFLKETTKPSEWEI